MTNSTSRSHLAASLLAASLLASAMAHAETRAVNAGPIFNHGQANRVCPSVCSRAGATWTRQWWTTVQGRMSVCECAFPEAQPATPALAIGRYRANHPHWSGYVNIAADHTYARDNGDPGTWTFDGTTLVLNWRNWGPETLTRQADGSFRAASNGFTLVHDPAPVAATPPPVVELMVNGGFEQAPIAAGSFQQVAELPGWRLCGGQAIEVQRRVAGAPGEGEQHVELAAESPTALCQDVAVTAGATYELSFLYAPRPGVDEANNAMDVRVNGERVMTARASGVGLSDTRWMRLSVPVRAAGASLRVEFRDVGTADSLGAYLDGVSLVAAR